MNKWSLICSTFLGTINLLHSTSLFVFISSRYHITFQLFLPSHFSFMEQMLMFFAIIVLRLVCFHLHGLIYQVLRCFVSPLRNCNSLFFNSCQLFILLELWVMIKSSLIFFNCPGTKTPPSRTVIRLHLLSCFSSPRLIYFYGATC